MRFILFFCIFLLLFNCEDKQKQQRTVTEISNEVQKETDDKPKVTPNNVKRKFPKLNDENAMEFFLQYEKDNKEDKVRITTDFGEIDILLFDNTKFHRANFIFLTKQKYFEILSNRAAGKTLSEVGRCYGLSRERVRQIEAKFIRLLHRHLKKELA